MRATYYKFNNSVELGFRNEQGDIDILAIVQEALMGVARAAMETNNAAKAIEALESVRDISDAVVSMENWKEEPKDE